MPDSPIVEPIIAEDGKKHDVTHDSLQAFANEIEDQYVAIGESIVEREKKIKKEETLLETDSRELAMLLGKWHGINAIALKIFGKPVAAKNTKDAGPKQG